MTKQTSIFWFRQDLRLCDNRALTEAAKLGQVLPVYVFDHNLKPPLQMGQASKAYLHQSLSSLNKSLDNCLNFYSQDPVKIIVALAQKYNAKNLIFNRCNEPWIRDYDKEIETKLQNLGVNCVSFNGSYLWTPEQVVKDDQSYYKVFGPYRKKGLLFKPNEPVAPPKSLLLVKDKDNKTTLEDLELNNSGLWSDKIKKAWSLGEKASQDKLKDFLSNGLFGYKKGRDFPGQGQTSRLSADLHFGQVSPNQVWHAAINAGKKNGAHIDLEQFLNELTWREFCAYLLFHFPKLQSNNFQKKFDQFPWQYNKDHFAAWKEGRTGYPLVDAGMRELAQTGYMHNRVRMVVASFLVKNLMIHWHLGQEWFWENLFDADLANNSANWQWVAGSGADAAPYFRIFNPTTQGEKFDKEGLYTKKFVPELKNLPNKYLFKPWKTPAQVLQGFGVVLGQNYPRPIVDLNESRTKALKAYKLL